MSEKKKSGGALLGAAFLMATSAIGPGFRHRQQPLPDSIRKVLDLLSWFP